MPVNSPSRLRARGLLSDPFSCSRIMSPSGILTQAAYPDGLNFRHQPTQIERDVRLRARDVAGVATVRVVGADVVGVVLNEGFRRR